MAGLSKSTLESLWGLAENPLSGGYGDPEIRYSADSHNAARWGMASAYRGRPALCLTPARTAPIIASHIVISSREDSNLQTELDGRGRRLFIAYQKTWI
ncbi:hypothetical protein [Mesorhizobium sp. M0185]|uniref:hypothetical protein n=1 Tax=Mesorhizobium sp. M0185 TaxID=2956907 RepID=UPI00333568C0